MKIEKWAFASFSLWSGIRIIFLSYLGAEVGEDHELFFNFILGQGWGEDLMENA